jgi:hypothetical protein
LAKDGRRRRGAEDVLVSLSLFRTVRPGFEVILLHTGPFGIRALVLNENDDFIFVFKIFVILPLYSKIEVKVCSYSVKSC